jgi:alpha-glucosidase
VGPEVTHPPRRDPPPPPTTPHPPRCYTAAMWWSSLLVGCSSDVLPLGSYVLEFDEERARFSIAGERGSLRDVEVLSGTGEVDAEMVFGAFTFDESALDLSTGSSYGRRYGMRYPPYVFPVLDERGESFGDLVVSSYDPYVTITFSASSPGNRVGFRAACDGDDHFLGLGSHVDVDHVGEAFPLWTSEPGIGKSDADDVQPLGFPLEGTKHATSYPTPFVLRPHHPDGLLFETGRRVTVDLCSSDPDVFSMVADEDGTATFVWFEGARPADVVRRYADWTGHVPPVPAWVFGAWADAIRGPDRVRAVADELREVEAPVTAIWSEDWKGATETPTGYRLGEEWFLDRGIYPDAEVLANELEDHGYQWLAYFAPFLGDEDPTFLDALEAGAVVENEAGEPYMFPGVSFQDVALVDPSGPDGRAWAVDRMRDAVELGFDGWMTDYGEWLPDDAVLDDGRTGAQAHNLYPELWQDVNREALQGEDAVFFARSGWTRTASLAPVVWGGDQRTSFDADDGFPTVIPLGLGAAMSGVSAWGHDVAGYQSVGNPPSTKELWFRWCELGAYSPVMRTHHGSYDTDNHQFDTDADTLAHFARYADEHVRLYPYLHGLHARSVRDGTPMLLPVSFVHDAPWDVTDAWLLGDLLVAPVLEAGATSREVDLPGDVAWWRWQTLEPARSGVLDVPLDDIPVFAPAGATIPTFADPPDTLLTEAVPGVSTLEDADGERVVYVFAEGRDFLEADGTSYDVSGRASEPAEVTARLRTGVVEVRGLRVKIDGPRTRDYTIVAR